MILYIILFIVLSILLYYFYIKLKKPKIIDAFMFFNELELLYFRLEELDPYVDYFVIVESPETFTGIPKPLYFENNKIKFKKFLPKIKHIIAPINNTGANNSTNYWKRETAQKNHIYKGIVKLKPDKNDIIIYSDLDEIPDMIGVTNDIIPKIKDKTIKIIPHWFNFNIDNYLGPQKEAAIPITKFYILQELMEGKNDISIRYDMPSEDWPENMGWHFSYFLTPENVLKKLRSYSHASDTKDRHILSKGLQYVKDKIKEGGELFGAASRKEFKGRMPNSRVPRLN